MKQVKITILCENTAGAPIGVVGEHGFSALIEGQEESILLDTGQGLGLKNNALILGADLSEVTKVVLSHGHYDHTGGLPQVLEAAEGAEIIAHPDIFSDKYAIANNGDDISYRYIGIPYRRSYLEDGYGVRFSFYSEFLEISKDVFFSGEVPRKTTFEHQDTNLVAGDLKRPDPLWDDTSLLMETRSGPVIITGCAHSGIVNVMNHFSEQTGHRKFHAVIGGTHLGFLHSEDQLEKTMNAFDDYGLDLIAVSHCTGNYAAARCFNRFGKRFAFAQAGTVFSF